MEKFSNNEIYINFTPMKTDYHIRRMDARAYINGYLSIEQSMQACRSCPSYGTVWSCPPLPGTYPGILDRFSEVILIGMTVKGEDSDGSISYGDLDLLSLPKRLETAKRLLRWEKEYGGRSFSTIGKCVFCGNKPCSRLSDLPCRHPELVRPSLEAVGFDLVRSADEILGIPLAWSGGEKKNNLQLTYIYGYFR